MKINLFYISLLFFVSYNSNSQRISDIVDPFSSNTTLFKNSNQNKTALNKIEGSPYLIEEFRSASISGIAQKLMIRYNAFTDIIEVQNENKELFSLTKSNPFNNIEIVLIPNKIKLINYLAKGNAFFGYLFEIYNQENLALYRRDRITLKKGKEASNSYQVATETMYVKENVEYYISFKNETALQMVKNKKELEAIFPNHKQEIEIFLKNNNYSFKKEQDLIEIAKFITTLIIK
ncbi:hypothetical protein [Flavobacterium sp.]|uniref:hypothetical protein n=1 Tax=Flavobacterium sp. TaxID=239 RepID=UPI00286A6B1B|nr:hypothetical protein [Flavobacterium sp.]